jgi:hypothetical protein
LTSSVALEGGIKQVSVNLRNTGFGIKTGEFDSPRVWFAHANAFARYNPVAGFLEIEERRGGLPGGWGNPPCVWLDLPMGYREQRIDEVDIRAFGYVEVGGLTVGDLFAETRGSVHVAGVHVGHACLVKSVKGDVYVTRMSASENVDPKKFPSAEVIALTGLASIAESSGAWRLTGQQVYAGDDVHGPRQVSLLTPIRNEQLPAASIVPISPGALAT